MDTAQPEVDFFRQSRLAVVGLGLMGGSLAMAVRGKCRAVWGVDPDPAALEQALAAQVIDQGELQPGEWLAQADFIVLAAPVEKILHLLAQLPALHPGSPIVIDLGSTKSEILKQMEALPERFEPVGGHPMCGKETGGFANASPHLYTGAAFALTPLPRTSQKTRAAVEQVVRAIGAHPIWLDAPTHDRWTAATSHAPYLVACALALATPAEAAALIGPGLRSTTRIAATNPTVMLDILQTNRAQSLAALNNFRTQMEAIASALENQDWDVLHSLLEQAASRQRTLIQNQR